VIAQPGSTLRGIGLMTIATLVFVINDTMMKVVTEGLPPFETLFLRGVAASIWSIPLILLTGNRRKVGAIVHPRVLIRNSFELVAVLFFVAALAKMPIADITAIIQFAPMLLLLGVAVFYREKIGRLRWVLIGIGFGGALMVAQPGGSSFTVYSLLGLGTAVMTAGRDIVGRRVPAEISGPVVAVGTILLVTFGAATAHLLLESWVVPSMRHLLLLGGSGLFLMFGHLFVFLAYRSGDIGATAPFFYTFTIWALLSGLIVFGTVPNTLALAGMALIIASGVAVALVSERRRKLRVIA